MIYLKALPESPGCYIYKNNKEEIIYIGKAKSIKKRVSSYFQKTSHDIKTQCLVENISSVDFIVTNNELEALILENTLIKRHKPKYNISLKFSGDYSYIQITDEKFPRVLLSYKKTGKGKFFGPFTSSQARYNILVLFNKAFQLRTCKRMPKKACLRYHIQLCCAPCIENIKKEEYTEKIDRIKLILKGKTEEILKSMSDEMSACSKNLNFEKAMELRNQINAVKMLNERQSMARNRVFNEDIINTVVRNGKVYLILFNIYKGTLTNKDEYSFTYTEDFFEEFIVQYYSEHNVPSELILKEEVNEAVIDFLSMRRKSRVRVTIPKKGEKKHLLDLVEKNIEISFFANITLLEEMKEKLNLEKLPDIIECFDISHLSGTSTVGSMVQFRNARPSKSNYRKFKIKDVKGVDDTKSIAEVVRRRYLRLSKSGGELPDLIIIDGGVGQLNAAVSELEKLGLVIPIISIAKRIEEIFKPGIKDPLLLEEKEKTLLLIREIRDEAHRFAIAYNRLLRSKEMLK